MADSFGLAVFCVALALPCAAATQPMTFADRHQMESLVNGLAAAQADELLLDKAAAVLADLGLTWGAPPALRPMPPAFSVSDGAVIELVDIRLLLTQIAIQTGARDHVALVRAQGPRDHGVILLRGGFVTLDDLFTLAQGTPAQPFLSQTAAGLVVTRPLAIWTDAGLTLDDDARLILARASGSFVANLGWLDVPGGSIVGAGAANTAEPGFRPFVLTAGRGSFTAEGATFRALGFGDAAVFGGVAIVNNGLVPPRVASAVSDSTLASVTSLALIGTAGAILSANDITGSNGTAILISNAHDSVVQSNRLSGLTGHQAIRITAGASEVRVAGNLVSGSSRTGILIDRDSRDIALTGNLVQGSLATGIAVDSATCVGITANLVATSGGAAISLSDTEAASVDDNAVLFNGGSGILIRNQATAAVVTVAGNVFVGNRDGLNGATPGQVTLEANNFDGQLPRVFAGDFAPLMAGWLRNRRDAVPVAVKTATSSAACANSGAN